MVRDRNLSGSTSAEGAPLYGADESVSTLYSLRACWGDAVCEEWRSGLRKCISSAVPAQHVHMTRVRVLPHELAPFFPENHVSHL